MDATALAAETIAVQQLLDELDLGITIRPDHVDRGVVETLPWTLMVAVPATTFLNAFMKRLGQRTGDAAGDAIAAAGRALREWMLRLQESRPGRECVLLVTDRVRGLDLLIPRDIPPEAYSQLTQLLETLPDLGADRPCELRWTKDGWVEEPL
jgi:hypothetical protein